MNTTKMDLVSIGELLIDMTPVNVKTSDGDSNGFIPNPGGAPANAAVMAAHMGVSTGCVAMVGDDGFGHMLVNTLKMHGVQTDNIILNSKLPTTLAIVQLDETGERQFSFYRKSCADGALTPDMISDNIFEDLKVLCFGSVSMAIEPLASSMEYAMTKAKESGSILAFDPNYRPLLWESEEMALSAMDKGVSFADILKVSEEEAFMISRCSDLDNAMKYFMDKGLKLVAITRGYKGVKIGISSTICGENFHRDMSEEYQGFRDKGDENSFYTFDFPAFQIPKVVDTTGAGDAFFGGLLGFMIDSEIVVNSSTKNNQATDSSSSDMTIIFEDFNKLVECVKASQAAAALCISEYGAIPAMPSKEAIETFLAKEGI